METVCIYHADCIDGAAAAAVVKYKFSDAELCAAIHGDKLPCETNGKRVFIVDFSYSADVLKEIADKAQEVHWYDHHKTALPIRDEVNFGVIDLDESGATLTWKQLFPDQEVPKILQYVRDKDIWLWELPNSRDTSAALRDSEGILDPTHSLWKSLLDGLPEDDWQEMIERGAFSRRLLRRRIEKAAKYGFPLTIEGHKAYAVNWTEDASEMGEYIYKELGYPIGITFAHTGTNWSFSLRSNTVDVSEIALLFGGGGHPGAAGFRADSLDCLLKGEA